MVAKWPLEIEIAMGAAPMPISVSSGHFALRYEVPKFLARKRCSIIPNQGLEVEIAMGCYPVPISVSSPCFALRYEVPKFLPRGGHLCMAMLTIAVDCSCPTS